MAPVPPAAAGEKFYYLLHLIWTLDLGCCDAVISGPSISTSPQLKQHLTAHWCPGLYRPDCRQADGGAGARVDRKQNFVLVSSVDSTR